MESVVKKIVSNAYNTTYKTLNESQKNNVMNRYVIKYNDLYRSEKIVFNNKTYYPSNKNVFISLRVNPLANKQKHDTFKNKDLYGKFLTTKYLSDNHIANIVIFVDGKKLTQDTKVLLKDNLMYIEYGNIPINRIEVFVFTMDVKLYKINNGDSVKDILKSNLLVFDKGIFTLDFNIDDDTFIYNGDECEIVQVYGYKYTNLNESGQTYIRYGKTKSVIYRDNILNFNNGLLLSTNDSTFNYISDGFIRSTKTLYGGICILWNPLVNDDYYTLLDRYASYRDMYTEIMSGTSHEIINNYYPYTLDNTCLDEYDKSFKYLIEHDRNIYYEYLDNSNKNNLIFNYKDIDEQFKHIRDNSKWIEHELQYMKFYSDRLLLSFKTGKNKEFNIFYNGELLTQQNMYFIFVNKICHCFIDTSKLKDIETSKFEVEICDYKYYNKTMKMTSYTDECHIEIEDMRNVDKKYLRCYINGRLINSANIIVNKADSLNDKYIVMFLCKTKLGDILTVEEFDKPINTLVEVDSLKNDVITIGKSYLRFPLSYKYYDLYINGCKIIDEEILSTCTIKIKGMKTARNLILQEKPSMEHINSTYESTFYNARDRWNELVDYYKPSSFIKPEGIRNLESNLYIDVYDTRKVYYQPLYEHYLKYNTIKAEDLIQDDIFISNFKYISDYVNNHFVIKLDATEEMLTSMLMTDRHECAHNEYYNNINGNSILDAGEFINPNDDLIFDDVAIIDSTEKIDNFKRIPEELVIGNGYEYIIEESESE